MLTKKILIATLTLVFVISLIPSLFYFYEFGSFTLSSHKDEWGLFGDFIGGTVNPFLSFANILTLGYLTYEISHIDQNAQERSLDIQRKLVLSQLRHDSFQDYVRVIDNVLHNYDDTGKELSKSVGQKSHIAAEKLRTLNENLGHLFPIFRTNILFENVLKTLSEISVSNANFLNSQKPNDALKLGQAIEKLRGEKRNIKEAMQNFMMSELGK